MISGPTKAKIFKKNKYVSTNTNKLVHLQTTYLQTSYAHFNKYSMPVSLSETGKNKMRFITSTRTEFLRLCNTQMLYCAVKRNITAVTHKWSTV